MNDHTFYTYDYYDKCYLTCIVNSLLSLTTIVGGVVVASMMCLKLTEYVIGLYSGS